MKTLSRHASLVSDLTGLQQMLFLFCKMQLALTLAPIWLPHWPAWMWTISRMSKFFSDRWVKKSSFGGEEGPSFSKRVWVDVHGAFHFLSAVGAALQRYTVRLFQLDPRALPFFRSSTCFPSLAKATSTVWNSDNIKSELTVKIRMFKIGKSCVGGRGTNWRRLLGPRAVDDAFGCRNDPLAVDQLVFYLVNDGTLKGAYKSL